MSRLPYFALAAVAGFAALLLAFAPGANQRIALYIQWSVYWTAASLLFLSILIVHRIIIWRSAAPVDMRSRLTDLTIALVLTVFIAALIPARYFIEQDESSMLGTAQGIAITHSPVAVSQGVFRDDGVLLATAQTLDKRGMFYPLLVALADAAVGKSLWNPARVNLLLGFATLFLALRLAKRYVAAALAPAVVILFASFTVVPITMRGGTLDISNTAFLLLLLHALTAYLDRPQRQNALLLVAASTVAALNRYETVALCSLAVFIVYLRSLHLAQRRDPLVTLTPLFMVPATWRFAIPMDYDLPGPWFNAWSMNNIPDNLERLLAWLLSPAGFSTGSVATGWLALIGLILLIIRLCKRGIPAPSWSQMAPLCIVATLLAILMASYWGQATSTITVRYFIPTALLAAILATYALGECLSALQTRRRAFMVILSALLVWTLNVQTMRQPPAYLESNFYRYRDNSVAGLAMHYQNCNVLLLSINNPMFISRQISTMAPITYEKIGLSALQAASNQSIRAVVFSVPLRDLQPLLPQEILQRWGTSDIHHRYLDGAHGVDLVQLWPALKIDSRLCRALPTARTIADMPGMTPMKSWLNSLDRWDPESDRHKALTRTLEPGDPDHAKED